MTYMLFIILLTGSTKLPMGPRGLGGADIFIGDTSGDRTIHREVEKSFLNLT